MRTRRPIHQSTLAAAGVYAVLLVAAFLEQWGRTTNDTKTPAIEAPRQFLAGVLSLWNPQYSMGELQNQAYGYLFPQGPFFVLGQLAHVPPWVTERLWSVLILVAACEGVRAVARAMGLAPWAALVAGFAYGLSPRMISEVGVRTGEILPAAALPWVLLPVVLALTGRLGVRRAGLFSASAFLFSGALNATATVAGLPVVVCVLIWGCRRKHAPWSLLGWWSGFIVVTSVWWAASLLKLRVFSPPFYDYVEDARITTSTTGYTSSLRGAANWVGYIFLGDSPVWPAGAMFAYRPWLVVASGLVAALGVVGLARWASPWRTPMLWSAVFGLVCLTAGHTWTLGSPLHGGIQTFLDGGFNLLRNVVKVDPSLRLPMAIGVGSAVTSAGRWATARVAETSRRRRRLRTASGWLGVAAIAALTLSMAQPAVAMDLRTPGWTTVPAYWHDTADYLAAQAATSDQTGQGSAARSWVIPGSSFGVQTWGWTMDEPMSAVASTPWVTRSQVPLTPPETIRVLSQLEGFLDSGAGSPNLGAMLARLGIGYVVVRHDLDPSLAEATSVSLVSIAMARSEGVTRVTAFGRIGLGPAIEIYRVDQAPAADLSVVPQATAVTVAGASSDVTNAVGQGLVRPDQAALVQGDDGWDAPAQVVGDSYRLRERDFGRVHDAEGAVLAPGEPLHGNRTTENYPGNPGSVAVHAQYGGVRYVVASSSQAYTNGLGPVRPETAPFSAVDADPLSTWRSALLQHEVGQWLEVRLPKAREIGPLRVTSPIANPQLGEVLAWRVDAGTVHRTVKVDPFTGLATTDLSNVVTDRVRLTAVKVKSARSTAPIGISDLRFDGLPATRTLVVPRATAVPGADYVFTAQPEVRTCITTLLAPDCDLARGRLSEESLGIDRTFEVGTSGSWSVEGTVIARSQPGALNLLDPLGAPIAVHASSTLASDPTVAPRMAYDGNLATTWMAGPYDPDVRLTVDYRTPHVIDSIGVGQPATPAIAPTSAVLRSGGEVRRVTIGGFGAFEPMTVKHLVITLQNPDRGLSPIGLSELYLGPKPVSVPLDGAERTGAVCGYGPPVVVDGRRYETSVDGFLGNVVSAGPLRMHLCDAQGHPVDAVPLTAGEHHLQVLSTNQFQPVITDLTTAGATQAPAAPDREFTVLTDGDTSQSISVGPGAAALLRTTKNFNIGWAATLDGKPLPVQQVDGWAQGWRIPAGQGGTIQVRFTPQRSYVILLEGGLAAAGVVLLAGIGLLFRTRLQTGRPVPDEPPARRDPRPWYRRPRLLAMLVLVPFACWVLGGVPAVLGVALAAGLALLRWRDLGPRLATVVAAGLLVAAPVVVAVSLHRGHASQVPASDLLSGTGFALVVATALRRTSPDERPDEA